MQAGENGQLSNKSVIIPMHWIQKDTDCHQSDSKNCCQEVEIWHFYLLINVMIISNAIILSVKVSGFKMQPLIAFTESGKSIYIHTYFPSNSKEY